MQLVFVAFDSVTHQPKSTNLISMTRKYNFKIDSLYVDDVHKLYEFTRLFWLYCRIYRRKKITPLKWSFV